MKKICLTIAFVFYFFIFFVVAQQTKFVTTYDYKNINKNALYPMSGFNDAQKYAITLLKRSHQLQQIVATKKDTTFKWNGAIGSKQIYSKDSLILFFIRPADTIKRPCILLTHGNNAKYRSDWNSPMNFYVIDLVMRGYCVAYYENPSSFEAKQLYDNHVEPIYKFNNPRNIYYSTMQSAVAAKVYVTHFAKQVNIDTNKILAAGFSFGALTSLQLAIAEEEKNFTDPIFQYQGDFMKKAIFNEPYSKNIKAVVSIGGGLFKDDTIASKNSKMGAFLDKNDSAVSFLFLHGYNDDLVKLNINIINDQTDTFPDIFFGEGPFAFINKRNKLQLKNKMKVFVNCDGDHNFMKTVCINTSPNCNLKWQWMQLPEPPNTISTSSSYFKNNNQITLLRAFEYMMQQQSEFGFIIGDFFRPFVVKNTSSVFIKSINYIRPINSYKAGEANGYYKIMNTACSK
jgi:dienelactone hydrolase